LPARGNVEQPGGRGRAPERLDAAVGKDLADVPERAGECQPGGEDLILVQHHGSGQCGDGGSAHHPVEGVKQQVALVEEPQHLRESLHRAG